MTPGTNFKKEGVTRVIMSHPTKAMDLKFGMHAQGQCQYDP